MYEPEPTARYEQHEEAEPANNQEQQSYPLGAARAQIHENYIVAQTSEGMVLVDQHVVRQCFEDPTVCIRICRQRVGDLSDESLAACCQCYLRSILTRALLGLFECLPNRQMKLQRQSPGPKSLTNDFVG